jgi:hypothetical protein
MPFVGERRLASITRSEIRAYIAARQNARTVSRKAFTFTA